VFINATTGEMKISLLHFVFLCHQVHLLINDFNVSKSKDQNRTQLQLD